MVSSYTVIFKYIVFFCLKIFFNSIDSDEMQYYAAFHLGLHCLQKYSFRGFPKYKGLMMLLYIIVDEGLIIDNAVVVKKILINT